MSFLDSVIKIFVGDKNKKDLKELEPFVKKVHVFDDEMNNLSIDDLREKTTYFKQKIKDATKPFQEKITNLKIEAETADVDRKEVIYEEVDKLNEESYAASEKVLNKIEAEAFAVMKETAKRFTKNNEIVVKATPYDRELSASNDFVSLDGEEKAVWKNSWDAKGTPISWQMIHYDVQLIGGSVLHSGKIAEMMTGEGKTLVSTLPIYLNALTGNGVHVVTVNDYLAKRDAAWMGPMFQFHGLSVDCVDLHQPNSDQRRKAYNADITYGTNNEFGFDYLRDNMSNSPNDLVQRPHNYTIIDEVDSVLIDDARTPLIISGAVPKGDIHEYNELKATVSELVNLQKNYLVKLLAEAKQEIADGNGKDGGFKLFRVFRGLPKNKALIKYLSEDGIKQLLQKTEKFFMQDNNREMPKIDETLYFSIDEKNNSINLTDKGIEHLSAKSEEDNFFVLPDISLLVAQIDKSEKTPEEKTEAKDDLYREFSVKSERIHTLNQLLKAYTLFEKDVEYVVMDEKVKIVDEQTGRIMDGRRYSDGLHQALEAKEDVNIEDATQTFATITLQNYFRMYKKLSGMTGTAITEAGELWDIYKLDVIEVPTNLPLIRKDKEDLIYKTKREKYDAVIVDILKIVEESRPVLVGTTSVEISEYLSKILGEKGIEHNVLNAKLHQKESEIVATAGKAGVVTIATNMAGRGTDIKLSDAVKEAGGLAIIGTERHDSRRVDRQLRGRAGRQGEPGSSQFYVSLEDNLMRLFGSERIAKMMDRMGLKEGEVIQHSMISKSIERAQKKVEENNFGIRKRLLEYDDIMNAQREVIYKRRRHALYGERLQVDIVNMIYDTCDHIIVENKTTGNFANFEYELIRFSSTESPFTEKEFNSKTNEELIDTLYDVVYKHYKAKIERNAIAAFPVIKNVYETQGDQYERIVVPFTDGTKKIDVVTNLKEAYESQGKVLINDFEKNVSLSIIDEAWKNHLRKMDDLKTSVQNAQYEQKDPLLIYKFESFKLFTAMLNNINKEVLSFLLKGGLPNQNPNQVSEAKEGQREKVKLSKAEFNNPAQNMQTNQAEQPQITETIIRTERKIGRNDKVEIRNVMNGDSKTVKYKQAIPLLEKGTWVLVN